MKNASSFEILSSTTGDFTSRVKNLFTSPLTKRKRAMSLNSVLNSEPSSSLTFGVPLEVLTEREGKDVPFIIRKIVLHVEENGLDQEGMYRVNGNAKVIERLKDEFDKVGDAEFPNDDIAAVGGLLKLFLRELPDGIIPTHLMDSFFLVQQTHPREATTEALNKLHHCLQMLPPVNLTVLRYLVRHLVKVAEYCEKNKMTAVSLSIVFGPNIFHCGSGLEALKRQGFSNAIVCRFIQYHRKLFTKTRSREAPAKPRPYAEYKAEKTFKQESFDGNSTLDMSIGSHDQSHDLEESYSERSIDEAIQERSAGTLSPASPTPLIEDLGPMKSKSPPPRPPPPTFSIQSEPLVVRPYNETHQAPPPSTNDTPLDSNYVNEADEPSNFSRRNAKRGMKFKTKPHNKNESMMSSRYRHSNGDLVAKVMMSRDEDLPMRTPSPYSWQSSPGTSPPTSPSLTPRSSRIINSVIEGSVKQFLFDNDPTSASQKDSGKRPKSLSNLQSVDLNRKDVYGLLLPERGQKSVGDTTESVESTGVKLRQPDQANADDTNTTVVRRRSKDLKKMRNRKSALFGSTESEPDDAPLSPIHDMDVQLVSVSPEAMNNEGSSHVEAMQGRVADLVKQYDESNPRSVSSEGGDGVKREVGDGVKLREKRGAAAESSGKKRSSLKAFEMFEKSGIIIGMGSPPPGLKPKKGVSFAGGSEGSENTATDPSSAAGGKESSRRTLTVVSEDLTGGNSLSIADEDVFTSPRPSNSSTPRHKPLSDRQPQQQQRQTTLSTTTSDDVFLSPLHATAATDSSTTSSPHREIEDEVDGSATGDGHHHQEFDDVKRSESKLSHLTLDRPKGPASRKRPKQRIASSPLPTTNTTQQAPITTVAARPHSKSLTTPSSSVAQSDGHDEPDFGVVETSKASSVREKTGGHSMALTASHTQDKRKEGHIKTAKVTGSPSRSKKRTQSSLNTDHTSTQTATSIKPIKEPSTVQQQPTAIPSSVPTLDLTSLAPEGKQAVREGWTEHGYCPSVSDGGGAVISSTKSKRGEGVKALNHRIQELKSVIKDFEADFTAKHGHKPSGIEKGPIRSQLEELSKLRQQRTRVKRSSEELMSRTAPPEVPTADGTPVGRGARLTQLSMESSSEQLSPREPPPPHSGSSETEQQPQVLQPPVVPSADLPIATATRSDTLTKILATLAARRKTAGRPEDIAEMTPEQVQQEKHSIQKALLNFEKVYGRPQTKSDKEAMRPLYDRYRTVKRVCSTGDFKRKEASLSVLSQSGVLEATTDSLPSITLLHSSIMSQSLPATTTTHPGSSTAAQPGHSDGSSKKATGLSKSAHGRTLQSTAEEAATVIHSITDSRTVEEGEKEEKVGGGDSLTEEVTLMTSEHLTQASLDELRSQHKVLMSKKKELRKVLKDFENGFQATHGRTVQREDRKPMQNEYSDYKNTKARLKVVETLMMKIDPQKTV